MGLDPDRDGVAMRNSPVILLVSALLLSGCGRWLIQEDGPVAISNRVFLTESSIAIKERRSGLFRGLEWFKGGRYTEGRFILSHRSLVYRPFSDTSRIQLDLIVNAKAGDTLAASIRAPGGTVDIDRPTYAATARDRVTGKRDSILTKVGDTAFVFRDEGIYTVILTRTVVRTGPRTAAEAGVRRPDNLVGGRSYDLVLGMRGASRNETRYEVVPVYRNNFLGVGLGLAFIAVFLIFTPGSAAPVGS